MGAVWQVQQAKNRFSELIDKALAEGPQVITRHGRAVVTVAAASDAAGAVPARDALVEPPRKKSRDEAAPAFTQSAGLTQKNQFTVPKAVYEHLGIGSGEAVDYEPLPDGSVRMVATPRKAAEEDNPFKKWRGTGTLKMPTDEIMRITRGDDWGR